MIVPCILCNVAVKSEHMKKHNEIDCIYREITCEKCKDKVRMANMDHHVLNECGETEVKCSNENCEHICKRKEYK